MNKIKIPKSFYLHGQKIKIEFNNNLRNLENDVGQADYRQSKIILQPIEKGYPNNEQLEQIFLHELIHHILDHMGKIDLRNNDEFIDLFANLLHQAFQTAEYDTKD